MSVCRRGALAGAALRSSTALAQPAPSQPAPEAAPPPAPEPTPDAEPEANHETSAPRRAGWWSRRSE